MWRYKFGVAMVVIVVSSALTKLYFAETYVTYTDEILSAVVAGSISETGLPVLPSGAIYPRAPLHHYLLAIPVGLFGIEYLAMRINSVAFSIVTVIVVYLLGSRVMSRQAAVVCAMIVSVSSVVNQFALSGRMYMTYGAFYIISLYFFYEGFVKGKTVSRWLALVFMAGTVLSSEAGVLLGVVFAGALIVYREGGWSRRRIAYIGCGIWIVLVWLVLFYDIPGSFDPFTAHSGVPAPATINAQMSLREIIVNMSYPWRALDRALPFSMAFFLVMTILVISRREVRRHYPLVVLVPALVTESLLTYRVQYRILIGLVPLYVLACCQLVETSLRWMTEFRHKCEGSGVGSTSRAAWFFLCGRVGSITMAVAAYALFFTVIAYTNNVRGARDLGPYVYSGFGYRDARAGRNVEPSYEYLGGHIRPDDVVVVTTVEYALIFLGEVYDYYYLRQKLNDAEGSRMFVPFERDRDPYYGRPIIDSVKKFRNLLDTSARPVWVVADHKIDSYVGRELSRMIGAEFELMFDDYERNRSRVYRRKRA